MAMEIIIARVYLTESSNLLKAVMAYLHDEIKVKGVTVFRAISGFGRSGEVHSADLLTMSMDLPLVVEFFDEPDKIKQAIDHLTGIVAVDHVVSWSATIS